MSSLRWTFRHLRLSNSFKSFATRAQLSCNSGALSYPTTREHWAILQLGSTELYCNSGALSYPATREQWAILQLGALSYTATRSTELYCNSEHWAILQLGALSYTATTLQFKKWAPLQLQRAEPYTGARALTHWVNYLANHQKLSYPAKPELRYSSIQ